MRTAYYSQGSEAMLRGGMTLYCDGLYEVTSTREYVGPYVFTDGRLEYSSFPGGYFDPAGGAMYYVTDWQGNNVAVVDKDGKVMQRTVYYPDGEPSIEPPGQRYLFGGKEREHAGGRNSYDFGARCLTPYGRWGVVDPMAEKFYTISPYSYCGGDPINRIDSNGMEWKYVKEDGDDPRFEWVETDKAHDRNGNLLPGHYVQAISFSAVGTKGKFDNNSKFNIGTSTATVYKADGSTEDFDACTYPSDTNKFSTIPAGRYEAKTGYHRNSYMALRVGDVGTENFYTGNVTLGETNKAFPNQGNLAEGINIHKAGINNKTGPTNDGGYVSMGCILIDRTRWDSFIGIFDAPKQTNNVVGIIILR